MEYYAIVSQGDEIPPLSEENDGGGTRASYMLIFKVASILWCMSIQIPIPEVSLNTPPLPQQPKFLAMWTCMTTLQSLPLCQIKTTYRSMYSV